MRASILALPVAALLLAAAPAPEALWKQGIADQNKDYAVIPHAMLKIQDSVYLAEGQSAVLVGNAGDPASWHWDHKPGARGPLSVSYGGGNIHVAHDGKPIAPEVVEKAIPIAPDIDVAGHPTQVGAGVNGWRIFVYNQKAPAAAAFKGVAYFPYDPAFRVTASFTPDAKLPPRVFRTSRGTDKQFYHAGDAQFLLKGKRIALPFYAESDKPDAITDMSAFFTDDLTGKGAYGAGRYVDVDGFGKFPPSKVTIDFNFAYNPNCARSAHFTCPVAVDGIALAMTAGERDPHSIH